VLTCLTIGVSNVLKYCSAQSNNNQINRAQDAMTYLSFVVTVSVLLKWLFGLYNKLEKLRTPENKKAIAYIWMFLVYTVAGFVLLATQGKEKSLQYSASTYFYLSASKYNYSF
jgi:hypothetical protein